MLDTAARGLMTGRSLDQLRSELYDREMLLVEADRAAQMEPGPVTLAQFRNARAQVEAVKRAIEIAASEG